MEADDDSHDDNDDNHSEDVVMTDHPIVTNICRVITLITVTTPHQASTTNHINKVSHETFLQPNIGTQLYQSFIEPISEMHFPRLALQNKLGTLSLGII